jgi:hypothetical protein
MLFEMRSVVISMSAILSPYSNGFLNKIIICSIDIIEFCIFDDETLDCFKTEFANV